MGLLYTPSQVFDNNGDPLNGALLYFFDASAHSTPKPTYTSSALTTPNANPMVATSAGRFGQAFAGSGEGYYIELRTAGGSLVVAWDDVTAVGEGEGSTFQRTFADARWKVSSGEVDGASTEGIIYEAGRSSPDDTGGFALFRGWNGTQADLIRFDAATVKVEGAMEIGAGVSLDGGASGNVVAMSANDMDLAASLSFTKSISTGTAFTFSNIPSGRMCAWTLKLTISSAAVPTWPASVKHPGGVNPSASLGNGTHRLGFITDDGGTTVDMVVISRARA